MSNRDYTVLHFLLATSVALIIPVLFYVYSNWSLRWVMPVTYTDFGVIQSVDPPIPYLLIHDNLPILVNRGYKKIIDANGV